MEGEARWFVGQERWRHSNSAKTGGYVHTFKYTSHIHKCTYVFTWYDGAWVKSGGGILIPPKQVDMYIHLNTHHIYTHIHMYSHGAMVRGSRAVAVF